MNALRDRNPWLIAALALVSLGAPLALLERYDLASQFTDDAFYYFQIAKNVAHGHGFTFDGLHPTNGFHPLWLCALIPVFGLVPGLDAAVRTAGLLEAALVALAAAGIYVGLRNRIGRPNAALAALLLFATPGERSILRVGQESALSVLLLVAIWRTWLALDDHDNDARAWLPLGALCGLAALTRLEMLAAVPALLLLGRARLLRDPKALATLLAPVLLCAGGYALWSWIEFDAWLPVSGLVKRYGYLHWVRRHPGLAIASVWSVPFAAGLAAAAWLWFARRGLRARIRRTGLDFLALVTALIVSGDLLTIGHLPLWYLGPCLLFAAVAASVALGPRVWLVRIGLAAAVAAAFARVPATLLAVRQHTFQAHLRGRAADMLRQLTPENARVGSWNGGMLGYYSGRHVIMLDGLANSTEFYHRVIVGGDLNGYLVQERIELLAIVHCMFFPPWMRPREMHKRLERQYRLEAVLSDDEHHTGCRGMTLWARQRYE